MKKDKNQTVIGEKKALKLIKKGKIYLDLGIIFLDEADSVLIPVCDADDSLKKSYFKTTSDFLLKLYEILH